MSTKKSEGAKAALVRIAIAEVSSELSFECESSPAEIKAAVAKALAFQRLGLAMLKLVNRLNVASVLAHNKCP
jgi:hypothetical protein